MRRGKLTQPCFLTHKEVYTLRRVAGPFPQGLSKRNYAIVQILLQAGMRIGEVSRLQLHDFVLHDRAGHAKIVDRKGHKYREVPLNATARKALAA